MLNFRLTKLPKTTFLAIQKSQNHTFEQFCKAKFHFLSKIALQNGNDCLDLNQTHIIFQKWANILKFWSKTTSSPCFIGIGPFFQAFSREASPLALSSSSSAEMGKVLQRNCYFQHPVPCNYVSCLTFDRKLVLLKQYIGQDQTSNT